MSGANSPPLPSPGAAGRRRASLGGQAFQDLFARQNSIGGHQTQPQPFPGPITNAAVNAQRRRLSLTTVGLSASPNQTSPFPPARPRTESLSSVNSGSVDESPFEDDPPPSATSGASSMPTTPFARRLSFGARALREVRESSGGHGNSNGRPSVHRKASSPPTPRGRGLSSSLSRTSPSTSSEMPVGCSDSLTSSPALSPATPSSTSSVPLPLLLAEHFKRRPSEVETLGDHELTSILSHTGDGYNFSENQRMRAERTSMSGAHPIHPPAPPQHQRAKSVTIMEPPPARELPKQPRVPDAMQERILKGDFYMD